VGKGRGEGEWGERDAARLAVLRESSLNRGGRARGCRYAMLGAIRRTGCSFVFRFVFNPPSPPPAPASASRNLRRVRDGGGGGGGSGGDRGRTDGGGMGGWMQGTGGGGGDGLDKRLIQTIIVDSRLEIHPADASGFFCRACARPSRRLDFSLFTLPSHAARSSRASFSATLLSPGHPAGLTGLLVAAAYRRRASSCPAIFRAGELDSTGLDRACRRCIEGIRMKGEGLRRFTSSIIDPPDAPADSRLIRGRGNFDRCLRLSARAK